MVSNMKELCEYSRNKKLARRHHHQQMIKIHGECSGLTDKEYKKSVVRQKKSFPQQYKFTHNKMWRKSIEKYSVEQLRIIAKS